MELHRHTDTTPTRYLPLTRSTIRQHPVWRRIPPDLQDDILVVSAVLPFRASPHAVEHLIDWSRVPHDPLYRLCFPHRDMLPPDDFAALRLLVLGDADPTLVARRVAAVRRRMNPHPAGQLTHNVPRLNGQPLPGVQHKYDQTVLFFPAAGQSCHTYCSFCFRWAQFINDKGLKFHSADTDGLQAYLARHPEVSDLLVTGGDPMVMNLSKLRASLDPLIANPELDHIRTIRIGTKSIASWPQRYVSDADADELLRYLERIVASGRHVAFMGHFNHPTEIDDPVARRAIERIRATGAEIRLQSPLVRHINDRAEAWRDLWLSAVNQGCVPYYMFVERNTGAKGYFEVPLVRAWRIFREAYGAVSGLARTVRGPSMSCFPGKILLDGVTEVSGEKVFALQFLQARNSAWVRRPFYAAYDPTATWYDDLKPAFGEERFFFEEEAWQDAARERQAR